jgi:hypothetical protein
VLIFQTKEDSSGSDKQSEQCLDCFGQIAQNMQLVFVDMYYGLWSGLGGGGGTFWLHIETLTFKGPAA